MIEELIAQHCAPALAGIKPSNLVSCRKSEFPNIKRDITRLNREFNGRGIYFKTVCECDKRILLLVYRKKLLYDCLCQSELQPLLKKCGYGGCRSLEDYISVLSKKLTRCDFPHEIGAFLGYPINDIYGFINHRDNGCLLVGEWRVYDNAECAAKIFKRYKICRNAVLKRLESGKTLSEIFCA